MTDSLLYSKVYFVELTLNRDRRLIQNKVHPTFRVMINCFMMKYVDFVAVVMHPYDQIVILRPEGAAVHSPGQRPGY